MAYQQDQAGDATLRGGAYSLSSLSVEEEIGPTNAAGGNQPQEDVPGYSAQPKAQWNGLSNPYDRPTTHPGHQNPANQGTGFADQFGSSETDSRPSTPVSSTGHGSQGRRSLPRLPPSSSSGLGNGSPSSPSRGGPSAVTSRVNSGRKPWPAAPGTQYTTPSPYTTSSLPPSNASAAPGTYSQLDTSYLPPPPPIGMYYPPYASTPGGGYPSSPSTQFNPYMFPPGFIPPYLPPGMPPGMPSHATNGLPQFPGFPPPNGMTYPYGFPPFPPPPLPTGPPPSTLPQPHSQSYQSQEEEEGSEEATLGPLPQSFLSAKQQTGMITPKALPEIKDSSMNRESYFGITNAVGEDPKDDRRASWEQQEDPAYGIGAIMLAPAEENGGERLDQVGRGPMSDVGQHADHAAYLSRYNGEERSASPPGLATPQFSRNTTANSSAESSGAYGASSADHRQSTVSIPTSVSTIDPGGPSGQRRGAELAPSWTHQSAGSRAPARWVQNKLFLHQSHAASASPSGGALGDGYFDDEDEEYEEEEEDEEEPEMNFFNPALLSHVSVQLRDRVERGRHVKGGIPWPHSFTGRDLVTTIQGFLPAYTRTSATDRRFALGVAHSLQNQLFFVEVDWDVKALQDSAEDVFQFMTELEGMAGTTYELPTGVQTMVTKCYSPSCQADNRCYSPRCPHKISADKFLLQSPPEEASTSAVTPPKIKEWSDGIPDEILAQIPESEKRRQNIIHQAILAEEQYEADLNAVETLFISPLRIANPPIVRSLKMLEDLIQDIFGNILELRETSSRLLEFFSVRQREGGPLITTIGDGFLSAAAEFHNTYPAYIGHLPQAEDRLREELAHNAEFRFFVDRMVRQNENRRMDIKHLITRPATQLQRYPKVLEAILNETPEDSPDAGFLAEAIKAIRNLGLAAQLRQFQASNGKDEPMHTLTDPNARQDPVATRENIGGKNWYQFVAVEDLATMTDDEKKLQETIWELIRGEMSYVADLRVVDTVFVQGLREADQPVIERSRLELFIDDVFHNYRNILEIHEGLLESLHSRQTEQHPHVGAIGDLIFDAALRWQETYLEYTSHYPKAKYALEKEQQSNTALSSFLEKCRNAPGTSKQGLDHFLILPIQRLLRYPLLLNSILKLLKRTGPEDHWDIETIPQVTELIAEQGKQSQQGVVSAEAKVSLWQLPNTIDGGKFGEGAVEALDLRNPMRELVHKAKLYRQPESSTISSSWTELTAYLFDTYFVLTKLGKSKNIDAPPKYVINRRPIPVELMTLGRFDDPAVARSVGLLRSFRSSERHGDAAENEAEPSRQLFPFTYATPSGQYTLWADSAAARAEWKTAFMHAKALRQADLDANKIFELTPLSVGTFYVAPTYAPQAIHNEMWTDRVVTTVPFRTSDNRELFGVGTAEGVWLGLRQDPRSLRKVLHLKGVTQIAVLEDFSLFLVLSNKSLLAYPLEALAPSSHNVGNQPVRGHQKISDSKHEVSFFAVGKLNGRTLVITMRQKGLDSVFRCMEPIAADREEDSRNRRFGGLSLLNQRSDWFRLYKEFFVASIATHVHFLKNKLVVVTSRSFEIIDLSELMPATIPAWPQKTDPALLSLRQRAEAARPISLLRASESEFLLCYDTFAFYVDRHGYPSRSHAIDYEGRPESIAFHPPYVLLFALGFVEIRHVSNMTLIQIVVATDVRCSFDGQNANPRYVLPTPGRNGYEEDTSLEPRVHLVKRSGEHRPNHKGYGQEIFELTPTLLLSASFPLPSVTDSNYFPPAPEVQFPSGGPSNGYGYTPWS